MPLKIGHMLVIMAFGLHWDLHDRVSLLRCSFFGESMDTESTLCFAYYKDGASDPTFVFFKHSLKEQKM